MRKTELSLFEVAQWSQIVRVRINYEKKYIVPALMGRPKTKIRDVRYAFVRIV